MKKNDNRGFSYVELLVVLAIMGMVVGVLALSMTLVSRTNVQKAGDRMLSAIDEARTNALTKGSNAGYLNVTVQKGAVYAYAGEKLTSVDLSDGRWDRISSSALEFRINNKKFENYSTEDEAVDVVHFHFSQSTGGLASDSKSNCEFIHGDKRCRIVVDSVTGKSVKQ